MAFAGEPWVVLANKGMLLGEDKPQPRERCSHQQSLPSIQDCDGRISLLAPTLLKAINLQQHLLSLVDIGLQVEDAGTRHN